MGIKASQLCILQFHAVWQAGTHDSDRNHVVLMDVLGTRQDLDKFSLSEIHLADPEMVGIGVALDRGHLTGDDAFQAFSQMDDPFHFQADVRQPVRQFFRRNVDFYIFL